MKILLLHAIRDLRSLRRTTLNQSFCLLKHAQEHEYTLHCFGHGVTPELRQREFDAIVIDTAPLSDLASRPLVRVADGAVLVIAAHRTSQDTALAALRRLYEDGTNVLGTIVNHPDPRRNRMRLPHTPVYSTQETSYESV